MLDSDTMHSFVYPRVVKLKNVKLCQGAVLTVSVTGDHKVLRNDVFKLDLTFLVEGGNC